MGRATWPKGFAGAALAAVLLSACQYDFPVRATLRDGRYVLTAPYTAGRFAPHTCVARLAVIEDESVIWEIANPAVGWPNEGRDCARSDFPIVYGEAPPGFTTVVAARPLRRGGVYRIEGGGISGYHGRFAIRSDLSVDNRRGR